MKSLRGSEHGTSAVEYVLIAALVALAAFGAWSVFGGAVEVSAACAAESIASGTPGPCVSAGRTEAAAFPPLPIVPTSYEARLRQALDALEDDFAAISGGDDHVTAEDLERACEAGNADACFLLESDAFRHALDVGSGAGDVDGKISLDDIHGLRDALERGDLREILADTAKGEGGRDGDVSRQDLEALLADESLPPDIRAWAEQRLADGDFVEPGCDFWDVGCHAGEVAGAVAGAGKWAWDQREIALTVISFVPGPGTIVDAFDFARTGMAVLRGDASWGDLAIAVVAFAPGGDVLKALKYTDEIAGVVSHVDEAADGVRALTHADEAADATRVLTHANEGADAGRIAGVADDTPAVRGGYCFTGGTPVQTASGAVAIERLHTGDRVESLGVTHEAPTRVDATWRRVTVQMPDPRGSGDLLAIELLRPAAWIDEVGATTGGSIALALPEMDISGVARVTSISDEAPRIAAGAGAVVLSTIASTSADVLVLSFEGTDATLEPTAWHRLYSIDRGAWVAARDLREGERLRTAHGAARVTAIERKPGAHRVYNLEVETTHSFFAGALSVHTHNDNPCAAPVPPTPRAFPSYRNAVDDAIQRSGLQGPTQPYRATTGPFEGRVVGRQSMDGQRGWRLDYDPNDASKGYHVNWWDWSGGNRGRGGFSGENRVDGATAAAEYSRMLDGLDH